MGAAHDLVCDLDAFSTIDHPSLQPNQVESNLFLSSAYTEGCVEILRKYGLSHILQVGYELQPHHLSGEFVYAKVQLEDRFDADIVQVLPKAFSFISQSLQKGGKVLVHCVHGQSRSAAIVIAYLMWRDHKPYFECLHKVRACRPRVGPNSGFEMQLCLLAELGFDYSRWPGWSAATFMVIRQQQLLLMQQQQSSSSELLPTAVQSVAAAALQPPPLLQQQEQLHEPQEQQTQGLKQEQQQSQQQQQLGCQEAIHHDLEQQDLLILAGPCPQLGPASDKGIHDSGAAPVSTGHPHGIGPALHVDVDGAMPQQRYIGRRHGLEGATGLATPHRGRLQAPVCCIIM